MREKTENLATGAILPPFGNFNNGCVSARIIYPNCFNGILEQIDSRYVDITLLINNCNNTTTDNQATLIYWFWGSSKNYAAEIHRCRLKSSCRAPTMAVKSSDLKVNWLDIVFFFKNHTLITNLSVSMHSDFKNKKRVFPLLASKNNNSDFHLKHVTIDKVGDIIKQGKNALNFLAKIFSIKRSRWTVKNLTKNFGASLAKKSYNPVRSSVHSPPLSYKSENILKKDKKYVALIHLLMTSFLNRSSKYRSKTEQFINITEAKVSSSQSTKFLQKHLNTANYYNSLQNLLKRTKNLTLSNKNYFKRNNRLVNGNEKFQKNHLARSLGRRKRSWLNEADDLAILMQEENPRYKDKITEMIASDFASHLDIDPPIVSSYGSSEGNLKNLDVMVNDLKSEKEKAASLGDVSETIASKEAHDDFHLKRLRSDIKKSEKQLAIAEVKRDQAEADLLANTNDKMTDMLAEKKADAEDTVKKLTERLHKLKEDFRVFKATTETTDKGTKRKLHGLVLIDPIWGDWNPWSKCSADCGEGGFSVKRRSCDTLPDVPCDGMSFDMRPCNAGLKCEAEWQNWGEWGPCSHSCGKAMRAKSRICMTGDQKVQCIGKSTILEQCSLPMCEDQNIVEPIADKRSVVVPVAPIAVALRSPEAILLQPYAWGEWGVWGSCSSTCGAGRQVRFRACLDQSKKTIIKVMNKDCGGGTDAQSRNCNGPCLAIPFAVGAAALGGAAAADFEDMHDGADVIQLNNGEGPRVIAKPKEIAIEVKDERESQLSSSTIMFIVLLILCVILVIISFCIWFLSRSADSKPKNSLESAQPFYKDNSDGSDPYSRGAVAPIHGVVKPVVKGDDQGGGSVVPLSKVKSEENERQRPPSPPPSPEASPTASRTHSPRKHHKHAEKKGMFIFGGKDNKRNKSRSDVAYEAGSGVRHKSSSSSSSSSSPKSDDNRRIIKKTKKKRSLSSVDAPSMKRSESVQTSLRIDCSDQVQEVAGAGPDNVHEDSNVDFSLRSRTQFLDKNFKAKLWSCDTSYPKYSKVKHRLRGARLIDRSRIEPLNANQDVVQESCKYSLKSYVCSENPNKTRSRLSLTKPKTAFVRHTFTSPRWSDGIPSNDTPMLYDIQEYDETQEFSDVITGQTFDPSGSLTQDADGERQGSVASMFVSGKDNKSEVSDVSPSAYSLTTELDREQSSSLAKTDDLWQKSSLAFRSNLPISPPRLSTISEERWGRARLNRIKSLDDGEATKCSLSPVRLPRTLSASRIYLVSLSPSKSTQVSSQEIMMKENKSAQSSERNDLAQELTLSETVSETQHQMLDVTLFPKMSEVEKSLSKLREQEEIAVEDNIGTENISDDSYQTTHELESRTLNQLSKTTPLTEKQTLEVLKSSETVEQRSVSDIFQMIQQGKVEYRVIQSPWTSKQHSETTPMAVVETTEVLKSETAEPQSSTHDFTGPQLKTLSDWEPSLPVVNESDSDGKYHSLQDSKSTSEMISVDQTQNLTDYKDPLEDSDTIFEDKTSNLESDYESQKESQSYEQKKELVLKMMQTAPNFYKTLSAVQASAQTQSGTFSLINLDTYKENSATLKDSSTANDIDSLLNADASLVWNAETGVASQETSSWTTGGTSNNAAYLLAVDQYDKSDQSEALSLDANVNKNKSRSGSIDLSKFRLMKTFCEGRDRVKIYGKFNSKGKFCSCHPKCAHQPTVEHVCPLLGAGLADACDCLCPGRFTEMKACRLGAAGRDDHCSAHACVHQYDFSQACINDLGLRLGSSDFRDHHGLSLATMGKPRFMGLVPDLSKSKHQKSVRFSESTLIDSSHCQSDTCLGVSSGHNMFDSSSSTSVAASESASAAKSTPESPGQQLKKLLNLQLQKFYETTVIKDTSDFHIDWAKTQGHKKQDKLSEPPVSARKMGSVSHHQSNRVISPPCSKPAHDKTAEHCYKYPRAVETESKAGCAEPVVATGHVPGNLTCINQPMKCAVLSDRRDLGNQKDLILGQINPCNERSPKQSDRMETNPEAVTSDFMKMLNPTCTQLLTKIYEGNQPLPLTCNYTPFSDVCSKLSPSRNRDNYMGGLFVQDSNLKSEPSGHWRISPGHLSAPSPGHNFVKYFDQSDLLQDHNLKHYGMLPLHSSSVAFADLKRHGDGSDDPDDSFVTAVEDNAWASVSDMGTKEGHDSETFSEQQSCTASISDDCNTRGKSIFDTETLPKYYLASERLSPRKSKPKIMHHQTKSFDPSNAELNPQQRLVPIDSNADGSFEKSSFTDVNSDLWSSPMRPNRRKNADRSLMLQGKTLFNGSPNEDEQDRFSCKRVSQDEWQPGQPHSVWISPSDMNTGRLSLQNRYSEECKTNLRYESVENEDFHEIISKMPSSISARSKEDLLGESFFTMQESDESPKKESCHELKHQRKNSRIFNMETSDVDGTYYESKVDKLPLKKSSERQSLGRLSAIKNSDTKTDEDRLSLKSMAPASISGVLLSVQRKLKKEKENQLLLHKSSSDTSLHSESNTQGDLTHKKALQKKWFSDESFQYEHKKLLEYRSPGEKRSLSEESAHWESPENFLVSSFSLQGDSSEDQTEYRLPTESLVHGRSSTKQMKYRSQGMYLGEFSDKRFPVKNLSGRTTLQTRSLIEHNFDRSPLEQSSFDLLGLQRKTSEKNKAEPSLDKDRLQGSSLRQKPSQHYRSQTPERPHKSSLRKMSFNEKSDQSLFRRPGEYSSSDESLLYRATLEDYEQYRSSFQKTSSDDDKLDLISYDRDANITSKEFDPDPFYLHRRSMSKRMPDRSTLQRKISEKCKLDEMSPERKKSGICKPKKSSLQKIVSNESRAKKSFPDQRSLKESETLQRSSDELKPDDMFIPKNSPHGQMRKLNEGKLNELSFQKSSSDEWKSDTSDSSLVQQKERLDDFKSPLQNVSAKEIQPAKSALRKTSSDKSKLQKRLSFEFTADQTPLEKISDNLETIPSILPKKSSEKCKPEKLAEKFKPEKSEICEPEKSTEKCKPENSTNTGIPIKPSLTTKSTKCKLDETKSLEPEGQSTLSEETTLKDMTTDEESKSFKSITSFDFSLDKVCQNQSQNKHEDSVSEQLFSTPYSLNDDRNIQADESSDLNSTTALSGTHSLIDLNSQGYHINLNTLSALDVKDASKILEVFSLGGSETNSWTSDQLDSSTMPKHDELLCTRIPSNSGFVNEDISYCKHSFTELRNQNHFDDLNNTTSQLSSIHNQHRFTSKSPSISKRNICQSSHIIGCSDSDLKGNILDASSIDLVISGEISDENVETTHFQLTLCKSSNSNALQTVDKMCGTDGPPMPHHSLQTVYRESLSVYDNFSNDSSIASDKLGSLKDPSSAPASSTFVTAISELRDDLTCPHTVQPHLKAQGSCKHEGQLEDTEEFFSISYQSNLGQQKAKILGTSNVGVKKLVSHCESVSSGKHETKSSSETDTLFYSPEGCKPTSHTLNTHNLPSVPRREKEVFRQETPKILLKNKEHKERRLEATNISLDKTMDPKPAVSVEKSDMLSPVAAEPVILCNQTERPNDESQVSEVPVKISSDPFFTNINPTSISFHHYHPTKSKLRHPHLARVSRKKSHHTKTKCKKKQPGPSAGFYKYESHSSPDGELALFEPLDNANVQLQETYGQCEQTLGVESKIEDQCNINVATDRENMKAIDELSVELKNVKSCQNISMDLTIELEDTKNSQILSIVHSEEMKYPKNSENFSIDLSKELKDTESIQPFSKDEELKNDKSCQNISKDFSEEFQLGQSQGVYSRTQFYRHKNEFFSNNMPSDDYDWVNFPSTSENTLSDISSDVFDKSGLNEMFQPLERTANTFSMNKALCLNLGSRCDKGTMAEDTSAGGPVLLGGASCALHTSDRVSAFVGQEGQRMTLRRECPEGTHTDQQCDSCSCQSEKFERLKIEYTVCYQRPSTGDDACCIDYLHEEKRMTVVSDVQEPPPDSLSGQSFEVVHSHSKPRSKSTRQQDSSNEHSGKTAHLNRDDFMHLKDSRKISSTPSHYSSKVSGQELFVGETNVTSILLQTRHHSGSVGSHSQDEMTTGQVHHSSTFDDQLQDELTAALVYQSRGSFTSSDQRSDILCLQSCCRQHHKSNYTGDEASSEMYHHTKPKALSSTVTSSHSKSRAPLDKEYQWLEYESISPQRVRRNAITKSRKMSAPSDSIVLFGDRYQSSNSQSSTYEYSHFKTNTRSHANTVDTTSFNNFGHEQNPRSYYGSFSPLDSFGEHLKPDTVQGTARHTTGYSQTQYRVQPDTIQGTVRHSRSKSQSKRSHFFEKY
ncbi:hypothetical protein Btru_033061 [Bulinus truncatus]|nr:hypothetical protein Btru_033061 [Bulinus truncatus]